MALARVTTKGQVTIPVTIRKALDIEEGDQLLFELNNDETVRVRVVKQRRLMDLYGALPATRPFPGKQAIREEVGKDLGQRRTRPQP
ncbi:MAG: AbrB/MazE/SpoVT family DNA-binding domain-containing protein [Candidatus Tectomicrobia bacterium]|nr:AbrB/MazE/SpoVT family DNA-binding domain-containing protein [Candidatus Tectomicrobia bacterium]